MNFYLKYLVLLFSLYFIEGAYRCDYKYSVVAKGWFKHFAIPATWADARLRCSLEGAVLASPTTPEIQAGMIDLIFHSNLSNSSQMEQPYEIFTGIHATITQGDYQTVEGTPLAMIPVTWAPNEPDNKDNNESCITLNVNGESADRSCKETRPYVCYREHPENSKQEVNECGTVDPEYHLDKRTNKCYKFHVVPRIFSRASLACTAEGGHLAIINNDLEANVLSEIFTKASSIKMIPKTWTEVAFIGFYNWGERGDWRTIHGQTLSEAGYNKFSASESINLTLGEYCGSIYRWGLLNYLGCDKAFSFICEKSPYYPAVCHGDEEQNK